MTDFELELNLDTNGRTAFDPAKITSRKKTASYGENESNDLDYTSKVTFTTLTSFENQETNETCVDELLFDCEVGYNLLRMVTALHPE